MNALPDVPRCFNGCDVLLVSGAAAASRDLVGVDLGVVVVAQPADAVIRE